MKNKKIIILTIIVLIILLWIKIFSSSSNIVEDMGIIEEFEEENINLIADENKIKGQGILTSFNIEELDTGMWTNIDEIYVNNEEIVKSNQKILKVSNEEAYGNIYSTISGKFFIQESSLENKFFIYDLDNIGLEIDVEESESVKLKLGQKADVKFSSISETFEGRICYISKIPVEGILKVKIKLNYSEKLKFGCSADVNILLNEEIDTSIQEYDIKNSFKKIGKTKITLKEQPDISIDFNFEEEIPIIDESQNLQDESDLDMGYDIEQVSKYYSDMWEKYWNSYWKAYYEEYQSYEIIEPADKSDIPNKDVNKQEEIEGE